MTIDHLSLATTPVLLFKGAEQVSQGTGFFYVGTRGEQQIVFLVTNVHVLTGHAPLDGKAPLGDSISFQLHKSADRTSDVHEIRVPLFTKGGKPVWIHSASVPEADLAVIPIPTGFYKDCHVAALSKDWMGGGGSGLKLRPTSPITLIGYPYGYYDKVNALPIWKTGNLACEPHLDFDGKPLLTIDISAFPGMSGAPACAIAYGTYEAEDGNTHVGSIKQFIGIYESMQMLNEKKFLEEFVYAKKLGVAHAESLQLGHVWKASLIEDLVASVDVPKWETDVLADLP